VLYLLNGLWRYVTLYALFVLHARNNNKLYVCNVSADDLAGGCFDWQLFSAVSAWQLVALSLVGSSTSLSVVVVYYWNYQHSCLRRSSCIWNRLCNSGFSTMLYENKPKSIYPPHVVINRSCNFKRSTDLSTNMPVTSTSHIADAWRVYLCLYVGHNLLKRMNWPFCPRNHVTCDMW